MTSLRSVLRWALALLIVCIPGSYLLWAWRFDDSPVLSALSYQSFHGHLSSSQEPAFWTYCPWVILVLLVMNALILLVAKVLEKVLSEQR